MGQGKYPGCGCENICRACQRAGGRELAKRAAQLSTVGRKNSPERMALLLDKFLEFPNVTKASLFAGITYPTLRYWLVRSAEGHPGDGYDLTYGDETKRFHEHFADVKEAAVQMVEDAYIDRAIRGYYEVLSDKGRVIYQQDPTLLALGCTGPDAWLLDDNGLPIPERIHLQDPDVQLQVLKAYRRKTWGQQDKLDVNVRGGVMVVGLRAQSSAQVDEREQRLLAAPTDVEFREVEDE